MTFLQPERYSHPGPVAVVPGRVAAWLDRHAGLSRIRIENRGLDPEVDAVLVALHLAGLAWKTSVGGQPVAPDDAPQPRSDRLTTREAARLLGVHPRTVVRHIAGGVLRAERIGRAWVVNQEDVQHLRANRAA